MERIDPTYAYDTSTYSIAIIEVPNLSLVSVDIGDTQPSTTTTIGFFTRDPIGFESDVNWYRFVRNQPTIWADPLGLDEIDISIGFPEDMVTRCAANWNWMITDHSFEIDPNNPNWQELEDFLNNMSPGDCLANVVFNGHGGPGSAGPFNGGNAGNPNTPEGQILNKIRDKICTDGDVDLRHCECAKGTGGKKFLTTMSIALGAPVKGIDDWWAITPHGDEFIAYPDGTIEKTCSRTPYKDTWLCKIQNGGGKKGIKPDKPKPKINKPAKPKPNVKKPTGRK